MSDSIEITLRLGEPLRRAVGQSRLDVELPSQATVAALIAFLDQTYPDFGHRFAGRDLGHDHPYVVFVNNAQISAEAYDQSVLRHDDRVHIVVPVAGGSS
ncbi:MAG: MoaD/ThiS family protein [Caldilineales bacterium]|nr:MoaD/ThiS family protein [Caldilineales bacterium]